MNPLAAARRAAVWSAVLALGTVALVVAIRPAAAAPTELFVSEYVEGSGSEKALELYNGTGAPVTLTGVYDVQIFANGSPTATATIPLAGTVADGDVFVLARSAASPAVLAAADQLTTNFLWNGNDAVALRRDGAVVDVIGQIGVDPGTEWGTGDVTTADHTLRRKPSVQAGDAEGSDPFDPTQEWDGYPLDTFDGLGSHDVGASPGGPGSPPVAGADETTVDEDSGESTIDVLANDSDPDGGPLALVAVDDPAHGSATAVGGAVVYEPDVDWNGGDSFVYTVSDAEGETATATVTVTVEPANDDPDAEDDAADAVEDGSATIPVLGNDEDVDGNTLAVGSVEDPEHGSALASGADVVYTPDPDWNGTERFEYSVVDGNGGTEAAEVVVTVSAVDDPPVAVADRVLVRDGGEALVPVLLNDLAGPADEAGQALTLVSVGPAGHGTTEAVLSGPAAGQVRYTPAPGFRGSDSFAYAVSDGGALATGTVTVTVLGASPRTICALDATIVGTAGDDVLEGTPGDDVIRAGRGRDVIDGNGGDDVICAGPGADQVTTAAGADRVAGGSGADVIDSGAGPDRVRGGFGADTITTGAGNDSVQAGPGDDTVDAGDGRNVVAAGRGDDHVTAGAGNDRVDGGPGVDVCEPGGGRNRVVNCP